MIDEPVRWGRVRLWDGSKGCPPVAVDKPCRVYYPDGSSSGSHGLANGTRWVWDYALSAYRIPAEFDHLDDNGNSADPFANYTSAELRAAADAKDEADDPLKPWKLLLINVRLLGDHDRQAIRLRDGAAKLLGVTL